jgi:hypothetical protein
MPETERKVTLKLELKPGDASAIRSSFEPLARDLNKMFSGVTGGAFAGGGGLGSMDALSKIKQTVGQVNYGPTLGAVNRLFGGKLGPLGVGGAGLLGMQLGGQIGGPVGGAIGGIGQLAAQGAAGFAATGSPVGALVAMIPVAVEAAKKAITLPLHMMTQGFQAAGKAISDIGGQLGAGGAVLSGLSGLAKQIPLVGEAASGLIDAFRGFMETALGTVRLASPGTQKRFELAQTDTLAVIGQTMQPVLEFLTSFTRLVGDFLKAVLPGTQGMRQALSPLSSALEQFREILKSIAPIVRELYYVGLRALNEELRVLAVALAFVSGVLQGLLGGPGEELPTSVGAAARGISFGSSVEQGTLAVYQAAYQNVQPGQEQESYLQLIQADVQAIRGAVAGAKSAGQTVGAFLAPATVGVRMAWRAIEQGR